MCQSLLSAQTIKLFADIGCEPFQCVERRKDGGAAALGEFAKARKEFVFLCNDEMSFGRQDVEHIEAAGRQSGHAPDAGVGIARFEAFVCFERNAEELRNLTGLVAEAHAFGAQPCTGFLSLFRGGRCHEFEC